MGLRRIRAAIDWARSIPGVINQGRGIVAAIKADPTTYGTPSSPTLVSVSTHLDTLEHAELDKKQKKGVKGARDQALKVVYADFDALLAYVQALADANEAKAVQIIKGAGFKVIKPRSYQKAPLSAELVPSQPGTVKLVANVSALAPSKKRGRLVNWEYTLDGGKTFVAAKPTYKGFTTISNLPLMTQVGFRCNVSNADGDGDWSGLVTILVH